MYPCVGTNCPLMYTVTTELLKMHTHTDAQNSTLMMMLNISFTHTT